MTAYTKSPAPRQTEFLDQAVSVSGPAFVVHVIARLSTGHKVRVRIHGNSIGRQSQATLEVLNEHLTWTTLVEPLPATWGAEVEIHEAVLRELYDEAILTLLDRAVTILG